MYSLKDLREPFVFDAITTQHVRDNIFTYKQIFNRDEFHALQQAVCCLMDSAEEEQKQLRAAIALILNDFSQRVLKGLGITLNAQAKYLDATFLPEPIDDSSVLGIYYHHGKCIEIPIYQDDSAIRLLLSTLHETMHMYQHFVCSAGLNSCDDISNEHYAKALKSFFKNIYAPNIDYTQIQYMKAYLAEDIFFDKTVFDVMRRQTMALIDTTQYTDKLIESHAMIFALHAARHAIDCTGWTNQDAVTMQRYIRKAAFQERGTSAHTLEIQTIDNDLGYELFGKCRNLMKQISKWVETVPLQEDMENVCAHEAESLQKSLDIIQQYSLRPVDSLCNDNIEVLPCQNINDFYEQLQHLVRCKNTVAHLLENTYVDMDCLTIYIDTDGDKEKPDIGDERD